MLTQTLKNLRARLGEAARDEEGTLTVEFIVMFPLLAFWFLGAITFFEAFRSNSLTAKVAYTISDIASKYGEGPTAADQGFQTQDLVELFQIQQRMMPRRTSRGSMRISSICFWKDKDESDGDDSKYRVLWSWVGDNGAGPSLSPLTDSEIPVAIMPFMADQDTVMFVEIYTDWKPISSLGGLMQPLTWSNRLAERPRVLPEGIPYLPDYPKTVCSETGPIGEA
ncbi:TadE/TadG family type IV pilus assembly protein [Halovulum sp. GXIMD14793]